MVKTIRFKSTQENWRKEYLGLKCNTVRKFDDKGDVRFQILRDFAFERWSAINVEIENSDTMETFCRRVTDVTEYDGYYIISWRHQ